MDKSDYIKILEIVLTSASWPLLILFVIIYLRKYLPLISRLKVQNVEIEFKEVLREIKKERIGTATSDSKVIVRSTDSLKPNMLELAAISPYAVILQAFALADAEIIGLAKRNTKKDFTNPISALQYLVEKKGLDEKMMNLFLRTLAIKERVVYTEETPNSKELALEIADVTLAIINDINTQLKK